MKWLLMIMAAALLTGCADKKDEAADAERQKHLTEMYKTPPPSDRSKDKGF